MPVRQRAGFSSLYSPYVKLEQIYVHVSLNRDSLRLLFSKVHVSCVTAGESEAKSLLVMKFICHWVFFCSCQNVLSFLSCSACQSRETVKHVCFTFLIHLNM